MEYGKIKLQQALEEQVKGYEYIEQSMSGKEKQQALNLVIMKIQEIQRALNILNLYGHGAES